jgi:hypothetical protein
LPESFRELDTYFYAKFPGFKQYKGEMMCIEPRHRKKILGYDTKYLYVEYSDGSSCETRITDEGYKFKCKWRNYWLGGWLFMEEKDERDVIAFSRK